VRPQYPLPKQINIFGNPRIPNPFIFLLSKVRNWWAYIWTKGEPVAFTLRKIA